MTLISVEATKNVMFGLETKEYDGMPVIEVAAGEDVEGVVDATLAVADDLYDCDVTLVFTSW